MFKVVLGWLGGSAFCLIPFLVLMLVQWMDTGDAPRGQGTLRLWLGAWTSYLSGAMLEALVSEGWTGWPQGGWLGRALGDALAAGLGRPLGITLSLLLFGAALSLYWTGLRARWIASGARSASGAAPREQTDMRTGLSRQPTLEMRVPHTAVPRGDRHGRSARPQPWTPPNRRSGEPKTYPITTTRPDAKPVSTARANASAAWLSREAARTTAPRLPTQPGAGQRVSAPMATVATPQPQVHASPAQRAAAALRASIYAMHGKDAGTGHSASANPAASQADIETSTHPLRSGLGDSRAHGEPTFSPTLDSASVQRSEYAEASTRALHPDPDGVVTNRASLPEPGAVGSIDLRDELQAALDAIAPFNDSTTTGALIPEPALEPGLLMDDELAGLTQPDMASISPSAGVEVPRPAQAAAMTIPSVSAPAPLRPEQLAPAWREAANEAVVPAQQGISAAASVPPPAAVADPAPHYTELAALDVVLPPLNLLAPAVPASISLSADALQEKAQLIEQRLKEFKVPVSVIGAEAGPVITRFEIEPAVGVRGSQIVGLMKDLSRALGVTSVRVVETIPGKTCMGLELPNAQRDMIRLSEILDARAYREPTSLLTLALGKDIIGNPVVADLARAPHMLVAGTTGSGKSVAINAMILSLLYKATPQDVRLIMIDPKMLELSVYEGIPHLLAPVVTDMKLAAHALSWCVGEMERRYRLLSALGVRNLAGYNQKIRQGKANERPLTNPFSLTPDAPEPLSTLPLIVVVIDELADLMMVAGKKIEELIARLAQKARAAGIHLILATQRPSVDVITGLIKANIPTRVAFQVSSKIDSRTILDQMGAESLLGQGDMLFLPPGTGYPQRVHGAFVADEEVHQVVEYLKQFGEPEYEESILAGPPAEGAAQDGLGDTPDVEADPLYDEAVAFVLRSRRASISAVQRQLRIGYNRAARLVEQMESAGLVSAMSHGGSREVLAPGPTE